MAINWARSEQELGITPDQIYNIYRPKVICSCDNCGREKKITIRVKSRVVDRQMEWECPKCVGNRKETKKKLSKARQDGSQNKGTAYYRWYQKHKQEISEKNKIERANETRICQGCEKELCKDEFYNNNTYIHPFCKKCEPEQKWEIHTKRLEYLRKRRKNNKKRKTYSTTTLEACERNNFNNIHSKNIKRCKKLNIECEIKKNQYESILSEWIKTNNGELTCYYCRERIVAFCFDHYVPLSRNGKHHIDNIKISCGPCNQKKHDLLPEEFEKLCKDGIINLKLRNIDNNSIYAYSKVIPNEWKFPYWSDKELSSDFARFMNKPIDNSISKSTITSHKYCRRIIKHFHKAFWLSTKINCLPVTEAFSSNDIIKEARKNCSRKSYIGLLDELSFKTRYKFPSIFDPMIAAEVMDRLTAKNDIIYDPCAGWGTRWLGALKTNRKYICSDPNDEIREGLYNIANYFKINLELYSYAVPEHPEIEPDIIFTSPPWKNREQYYGLECDMSNVANEVCAMASKILKNDGKLILHIPNTKGLPDPDDKVIFKARSTYSGIYENPIFIWNKESLVEFF